MHQAGGKKRNFNLLAKPSEDCPKKTDGGDLSDSS